MLQELKELLSLGVKDGQKVVLQYLEEMSTHLRSAKKLNESPSESELSLDDIILELGKLKYLVLTELKKEDQSKVFDLFESIDAELLSVDSVAFFEAIDTHLACLQAVKDSVFREQLRSQGRRGNINKFFQLLFFIPVLVGSIYSFYRVYGEELEVVSSTVLWPPHLAFNVNEQAATSQDSLGRAYKCYFVFDCSTAFKQDLDLRANPSLFESFRKAFAFEGTEEVSGVLLRYMIENDSPSSVYVGNLDLNFELLDAQKVVDLVKLTEEDNVSIYFDDGLVEALNRGPEPVLNLSVNYDVELKSIKTGQLENMSKMLDAESFYPYERFYLFGDYKVFRMPLHFTSSNEYAGIEKIDCRDLFSISGEEMLKNCYRVMEKDELMQVVEVWAVNTLSLTYSYTSLLKKEVKGSSQPNYKDLVLYKPDGITVLSDFGGMETGAGSGAMGKRSLRLLSMALNPEDRQAAETPLLIKRYVKLDGKGKRSIFIDEFIPENGLLSIYLYIDTVENGQHQMTLSVQDVFSHSDRFQYLDPYIPPFKKGDILNEWGFSEEEYDDFYYYEDFEPQTFKETKAIDVFADVYVKEYLRKYSGDHSFDFSDMKIGTALKLLSDSASCEVGGCFPLEPYELRYIEKTGDSLAINSGRAGWYNILEMVADRMDYEINISGKIITVSKGEPKADAKQ